YSEVGRAGYMGKRSAVVELFLGDMGSMQRELRPSTQREDQLTMETKLEQIAVKAVNQLPKSVVREIRTPRSVGAGGGRPPPATRWDGKRSVAEWPKLPRPSSTLPFRTWRDVWFESAMRTTTDIQAGCIKGNTAASIAMTASRFEHVPWCGTTCAAAKSYDNIRDPFAHYRHLPNKR